MIDMDDNDNDKEFSLQLFGLSSSATLPELKKKYRELIKLYHPDKHPDRIEWSTRMVQQLNEAYKVILAQLRRFSGVDPGLFESRTKGVRPQSDFKNIVDDGDMALRDAVVIGWLKRTPKDDFAFTFKRRIENALKNLTIVAMKNDIPIPELESYAELFSVFLEATVEKSARPLPSLANPTRFLKNLAQANKLLDTGIRNFYHFKDNGTLKNLGNIPLSFLTDSIRMYGELSYGLDDKATVRLVNARMKLARLFQTRIRDPENAMVW